jgi:hypothetical protein
MSSGSRPVPPLGRPSRPLKHPGRTLADPRRSSLGARVEPEVAALLARGPASHSLAAGLLASADTAAAWQVG